MQNLYMPAQRGNEILPEVNFDAEKHLLIFSEECMPEDSEDYFIPLLKWLDEYFEWHTGDVVFQFKIVFFSDSCIRYFRKIFEKLEAHQKKGNVLVQFFHYADDFDYEEEMRDWVENNTFKREFIPYE